MKYLELILKLLAFFCVTTEIQAEVFLECTEIKEDDNREPTSILVKEKNCGRVQLVFNKDHRWEGKFEKKVRTFKSGDIYEASYECFDGSVQDGSNYKSCYTNFHHYVQNRTIWFGIASEIHDNLVRYELRVLDRTFDLVCNKKQLKDNTQFPMTSPLLDKNKRSQSIKPYSTGERPD